MLNENERALLESQAVELAPVADYSKPGTVRGLILPNGIKLMNMREVSHAAFVIYSQKLNADMFTMSGTWTFSPDPDSIVVDHFPQGVSRGKRS